ncbi:hypothetical protein SAMN05421790_103133 [Kroppenstedtia eburnea]|uniref:Uncharacterized protein n=1 Tax=Kroppenstedtia eburnea TaxID=714067 RepID=A0A1N7KKN4_9BACL|nr:hypothetical protein SAMN05421790_103133 [Kroppenstedtia eburnea]
MSSFGFHQAPPELIPVLFIKSFTSVFRHFRHANVQLAPIFQKSVSDLSILLVGTAYIPKGISIRKIWRWVDGKVRRDRPFTGIQEV